MLQTEAIKKFLVAKTHQDLADLYTEEMEVQVNAAQDGGTRVTKEYQGRQWHGWCSDQDPTQIWKSFRIPYKAKTNPEYTPKRMSWPLGQHAEGVGMTGWNWVQRKSLWVAYDFDSIANHEQGLTAEELEELRTAAMAVDWVSVRKSTSGSGFHIYIFLNGVQTQNHTEHAALGRAVLGMLSAKTGFDFHSKVDACGGNMWVWHRKMLGTDGLKLIKTGSILTDIPTNWEDHLEVVKGNRRKNLPRYVEVADVDDFEELCGTRPRIKLDDAHIRLHTFLDEIGAQWWWDQDHWMMVAHTADLKRAHEELGFRGIFETIATGKERGADHNCYAFPMRRGGWSVRRYTPGVREHASWTQDGIGYTCCFYNQEPDLNTAARSNDGVETEQGGFVFTEAEVAVTVADALGAKVELPRWACSREAILKHHKKDGRLVVEIKRESEDNGGDMRGWKADKNWWKRIYNVKAVPSTEPEVGNYDELVRHLITQQGDDYGWVVNAGNGWQTEPITHVKLSLKSLGFSDREISVILGNCVLRGWTLVNIPFDDEFPGDRRWNRNAAQLRYKPKLEEPFECPTWLSVMDHCGEGLTEEVKKHPWCQQHGILTGGEYLKLWVASLFQRPTDPLPYLFFFSEQENTGKSTFHEALSLLMTKGYVRADTALSSSAAFNGELENAVLCVVEEVNLSKSKDARNRMKDWVTAKFIPIHRKNQTPYHIPNTTHWVQCANDPTFCPIFPGDTRITMCYVSQLSEDKLIAKGRLMQLLEKEASDFLGDIMSIELPRVDERLGVPVIETQVKKQTARTNMTPLQLFIDERCFKVEGASVRFAEFYQQYQAWLDPEEAGNWSKIRVGRELPREYPKGRIVSDGSQFHVGNVSLVADVEPSPIFTVRDNKLIKEDACPKR
jgi:hypothetical protein